MWEGLRREGAGTDPEDKHGQRISGMAGTQREQELGGFRFLCPRLCRIVESGPLAVLF